jgi:hypothetical protein
MKNHSIAIQTVKNVFGNQLIVATLLILFMLNGLASAEPVKFVPFREFIDKTTTATVGDYLSLPGSAVKDAAAFEEMRQHILNMYQDVDVNHSFVLNSAHYD